MMKIARKLAAVLILMSIGVAAQAGHLFTQASTNTPILLNAGFGISIPQLGLESGGPSSTSFINLTDFGSGDILQMTLGSEVRVFDFDSMPSGATATSIQIDTTSATSTADPAIAALSLTPNFTWRIDALAGSFTLLGYRIRISTGTVDGTNSGLVNQTGVTATSTTPVPIFSPVHLVLLVLGLIGITTVGLRRRNS